MEVVSEITSSLSKDLWQLIYVDSEELYGEDGAAENAFDGNPNTFWHTEWLNSNPRPPHEIQIDLGANYGIDGLRYLPRQDGEDNGSIGRYEFYISDSPSKWGSPVVSGSFPNTSSEQEIIFARRGGRFIRLRALTEVNGNPWTSIAEINVIGSISSGNQTPKEVINAPDDNVVIRAGETLDSDGDGIDDTDDNCPSITNTDQLDNDGDGIGDACDADADGDGFTVDNNDCNDLDPDINPNAYDIKNDGIDQDCDGLDRTSRSNSSNSRRRR